MSAHSVTEMAIERYRGANGVPDVDRIAVEAPLEIRLHAETPDRLVHETVAVTMRTPGHDAELAAGYLFAEGVVRARDEIADIHPCDAEDDCGEHHAIRVCLTPGTAVAPSRLARLDRRAVTTSSCGVCGKTSVEAIATLTPLPLPPGGPRVDAELLHQLPLALGEAQEGFAATGGLHAAALFDDAGRMELLREDVGRHNAVDKVIGATLLAGGLPATQRILLVSGRASFELVQKAVMAGIPVLAAVGAPSSLAVELAERAGMTLVGFLRQRRFNVYAGAERLRETVPDHLIKLPWLDLPITGAKSSWVAPRPTRA